MNNRTPDKDLPILLKYSELLLDLFENNFETRFKYSIDDHFAFMILCFLSKQKEHLISAMTLVKSESYSDAMIISRNMIEGVGIISWVSEDLQKRALQWRKYSVVSDYRLTLKKANGDKSKLDKEILNRSLSEGYEFLKESLKKPKTQLNNLPLDPFKKSWLFDENGNEVKIYKLFGTDNKVLYEIYGEMSDWAHWNVSRIGTRINRNSSEVEFHSSKAQDGCLALSSAIISIEYFFRFANKHLNLKLIEELDKLMNNFKIDMEINT